MSFSFWICVEKVAREQGYSPSDLFHKIDDDPLNLAKSFVHREPPDMLVLLFFFYDLSKQISFYFLSYIALNINDFYVEPAGMR